MFFIFGLGHPKRTSYGAVEQRECPNCHNTRAWQLEKVASFFTLFFLPIFSYKNEYRLYCPICKYGIKLDKAAFERYAMLAEGQSSF